MSEVATLTLGDQTVELPVVTGVDGERGIDVTKLRAQTGAITLDPGYWNTGSCESGVTLVEGSEGLLHYRGYPIEELAEKSSFIEVAYLLVHGELPTADQLAAFDQSIRFHSLLHEDMKEFFGAFPKDAHPMAACSAAAGALSTFYPDSLDPRDPEQVEISVHRLIAKMPTIASYAYKHSVGQPFMYPRDELSYVGNFLHMMFATPCEDYQPDPVIERAIELLMVLQADHGQNCSTSCVRLVGSSMVNLFAAISAGINALWGPQHSGDNRAVIEMLAWIRQEGLSGKAILDRVKDSDGGERLQGFGHRIYEKFDPRARILEPVYKELIGRVGINTKFLEIATEIEQGVSEDPYFEEQGLFPTYEFYSAVMFNAVGFPSDTFTVLSAMARLPGWIANWSELHEDSSFKIARPRQIYTGPNKTAYTEPGDRS
ncbi:MAG: citrate synthase [Myxococcota bacterium]|jgi:citrate synthase|nr:citrate synthase [Myxococcota bacterium]